MRRPKKFVKMGHIGDAAIGGDIADVIIISYQNARGGFHAAFIDIVGGG